MDQQQQDELEVDYGYEPAAPRRHWSVERNQHNNNNAYLGKGGRPQLEHQDSTLGGLVVNDDLSDETTIGETYQDDSKPNILSPGTKEEVTEVERLAKSNKGKIQKGRGFVILIMLLLGALGSMATFFYLKAWDDNDFDDGFEDFANIIENTIEIKIQHLREALLGLSSELTAYSINSNQTTFPLVTMPWFEVNAYTTRILAGGLELLTWHPLVHQRQEWEFYSVENQWWLEQSKMVDAQRRGSSSSAASTTDQPQTQLISASIFERDPGSNRDILAGDEAPDRNLYAPVWLSSPAVASLVNLNVLTPKLFARDYSVLNEVEDIILGSAIKAADVFNNNIFPSQDPHPDISERPYAVAFTPVFKDLKSPIRKTDIVGFFVGWFDFLSMFSHLLPEGVFGIDAVVGNSCNQTWTFCIRGTEADFCGTGDNHDSNYGDWHRAFPIQINSLSSDDSGLGLCLYSIDVYATSEFEDRYVSSLPFIAMAVIATLFLSMGMSFLIYDRFVQTKNKQVVGAAARSTAILSSLFPAQVRDRLFASAYSKGGGNDERKPFRPGAQTRLRRFLNNESVDDEENVQDREAGQMQLSKTKPIADLFPDTTVMFADIVGFTAWSSVREPAQVFTLLETLYAAFDEIAKRRHVFKVETVGDCYVAVVGLPDPRKDHAVVMARFARDIMARMEFLTKSMEVELGPDTGDLCMRVGLHSGPVTAGVLRGDRARFQLFGDTMNMAARMESTGSPRKIQFSEETAEFLRAAGKEDWIRKREDVVTVKGKGSLKTYWLTQNGGRKETASLANGMSFRRPSMVQNFIISDASNDQAIEKTTRLIEWNVEVLLKLLKLTVARRKDAEAAARREVLKSIKLTAARRKDAAARGEVLKSIKINLARGKSLRPRKRRGDFRTMEKHGSQAFGTGSYASRKEDTSEERPQKTGDVSDESSCKVECAPKNPLDEVIEVIRLPDFDANSRFISDPDDADVNHAAIQQLTHLVTEIAGMYSRQNPFHNFEHASHVTMSVVKLLSRIVAPELDVDDGGVSKGTKSIANVLHDHTYGITSDPLTQYACVFSALIHDVDHSGVPNTRLVEEMVPIADKYKGKSVAEQNSVDLSWNLFMEDRFAELRASLCATESDLKRLRQLVVNSVMATDIMDKDLKALRNARWEKAFTEAAGQESCSENRNRKATIVIEHLIQASDVAHTMQHWHIYRKWNERLFAEMAKAYEEGRAEKHPAEFWYKGEIGFFDFYIIPLAKKLKDCGVFGVSSDEYLNYALKNRQEWSMRGQEVVGEMLEKLHLSGVPTSRWEREHKSTRRMSGRLLATSDHGHSPPECIPGKWQRRLSTGSRYSSDGSERSLGGFFFGNHRRFSGNGPGGQRVSRRHSASYAAARNNSAGPSVQPRRASASFVPLRFSGRWFKEEDEYRDVAIHKPRRSDSRERKARYSNSELKVSTEEDPGSTHKSSGEDVTTPLKTTPVPVITYGFTSATDDTLSIISIPSEMEESNDSVVFFNIENSSHRKIRRGDTISRSIPKQGDQPKKSNLKRHQPRTLATKNAQHAAKENPCLKQLSASPTPKSKSVTSLSNKPTSQGSVPLSMTNGTEKSSDDLAKEKTKQRRAAEVPSRRRASESPEPRRGPDSPEQRNFPGTPPRRRPPPSSERGRNPVNSRKGKGFSSIIEHNVLASRDSPVCKMHAKTLKNGCRGGEGKDVLKHKPRRKRRDGTVLGQGDTASDLVAFLADGTLLRTRDGSPAKMSIGEESTLVSL